MSKKIILVAITTVWFLMLGSQIKAATNELKNNQVAECTVTFSTQSCSLKYNQTVIAIKLLTQYIDDEKLIAGILVTNNGKSYKLTTSNVVSMLEQDVGYLLLQDINFDGKPDLALSTSFGVANQYFDYWVYLPDIDNYKYVGNLAKLELNFEHKEVHNQEKISASEYQENTYIWDKNDLIPKSK